ncbi:TrmB family transcriptional regulator [Halorussus lipolyticus]|uniref:TrmB family transcriptional regulator n=1 Tax=Halorussus lipolyticus TaxID=3034024 RepID=UPI0023E8C3C8|nr:helix-turn-helix domain-containing protein [Halorussus sp. DT80]
MSSSDSHDNRDQAVELLQQLGLKEYEAKCFVALSRIREATAKEISESSEVPRTRVYDAVRILEAQGLVEVQHGSPQLFRSVPVEEAIATLRDQYESRFDTLQDVIEDLDRPAKTENDSVHEVWSLSGTTATANRTHRLIENVDEELFLLVGHPNLVTDDLMESLDDATDRGVSVIVGTEDESVRDAISERVPNAEVFVSELDWLNGTGENANDVKIGRVLLGDRSTILISSIEPETDKERAVYGRGFSNGLVVIIRRLMSTGLLQSADPGKQNDE